MNNRLITDEERELIHKEEQRIKTYKLAVKVINEEELSTQLNIFKNGLFCGFVTYSNN